MREKTHTQISSKKNILCPRWIDRCLTTKAVGHNHPNKQTVIVLLSIQVKEAIILIM